MEAAVSQPRVAQMLSNSRPRAVVVYEDFQTVARTRNLVRSLLGRERGDLASEAGFWKFDLLHNAALAEQAVEEASFAEIIVLSLHGNSDLPEPVRRWLERSLQRRTNKTGVLGALLDESTEHSPASRSLIDSLEALTRAAELQFVPLFSDSGDYARSDIQPAPKLQAGDR